MKYSYKNIINGFVKKSLSNLKTLLVIARNLFRQDIETIIKVFSFVPPGHFYSPFPSIKDIRKNEDRIFHDFPRKIAGIDLNENKQWAMFNVFSEYYKELPFKDYKSKDLRYYYQNGSYGYSDAICLYSMIRHARPERIIEVGSGFSSCVILDTNELFFKEAIKTSFIEPYPDLLMSLIKKDDLGKITLIPKKLQDVELDFFRSLEKNDILLIDSSHVSKIDSDVNYLIFKVLPILSSGVYIHCHDIVYPFEYPREWVYQGRAWNEAYLLRAFLQYNSSFEIVFFNSFLELLFPERFQDQMPLCLQNLGGSLWMRKL